MHPVSFILLFHKAAQPVYAICNKEKHPIFNVQSKEQKLKNTNILILLKVY